MKAEEPEKHQWDKVNNWAEELELLHSILAKTELVETVKWGGPTFTLNGKNVVGIAGFKHYFAIWFFNGVFLKDERRLLVNAQEGVTKKLRQWRFYKKEEVNEKLLLEYVNEAIANEKSGKSVKPQPKERPVSLLFEKELDADQKLKSAFENFTPGRQKEFLEYVETAKREETKLSRIAKIKPMILQNIGLNDKYK